MEQIYALVFKLGQQVSGFEQQRIALEKQVDELKDDLKELKKENDMGNEKLTEQITTLLERMATVRGQVELICQQVNMPVPQIVVNANTNLSEFGGDANIQQDITNQ